MKNEEQHNVAEKKCLNCGAVLTGKYCSQCGQKEVHLHEPFFHLFVHAFADYWHFDSKLVRTAKPLLIRPGFLTNEFKAGRIASYVHPVQLYFFISVLFFFFYFSFSKPELIVDDPNKTDDSIAHAALNQMQDSLKSEPGMVPVDITIGADAWNKLPATIPEYDDSIGKLPKEQRPSLFRQWVAHINIKFKQKGEAEAMKEIQENFNHHLPKIMFVLLPIFALLLKLFYVRRKIYFVDHGIFTLHIHAFAFTLLLISLILSLIFTPMSFSGYAVLIICFYLFIAMRKVYRQSFGKTLAKFFLLLFFYGIAFGVVMTGVLVYSLLMV